MTYEEWQQAVVILALMDMMGLDEVEIGVHRAISAGHDRTLTVEEDKVNGVLKLRRQRK